MQLARISISVAISMGICLFAEVGSAQTCQIPGLTVGGFYAFSALGAGLPGSLLNGSGTSTTTGTTTGTSTSTGTTTGSATSGAATTPSYSTTELGQLVGGSAGTGAFASSGLLYLDGAGNILAYASPTTTASTLVGGYVINANCSITVTVGDAFGTITTPMTFQGVILNNGAEIDLGVEQNLAAGLYGSNTLVKLIRTASMACSIGSLSGSYSLVASGTRVANQMEAPFFILAVVQFDGNGNIVPAPSTPGSSTPASAQSYLQFSGTYTVNPDCTGTMKITIPGASSGSTGSTSSANSSLSLSFVLTPPNVPASQANIGTARSLPLGIQFSQSGPTEMISGYGVAE